jgi:hypothetical protein
VRPRAPADIDRIAAYAINGGESTVRLHVLVVVVHGEAPGYLSVNAGDAVLMCQKEGGEDTYIHAYSIPLQTSGLSPARAVS